MKSALITGANRSIGLETAKQLSKKGLFIYLGSRDIDKGKIIVKELANQGYSNIKAIEIDVTKPDTILKAKYIIENEQGKLDVLINNAGVFGGYSQSVFNTSIDLFKEVFETNLFGVISVTKIFIELLRKAEEPRIVNVSTSKGNKNYKKVIAQQVEKVYPQAVSLMTDVIPDIYKMSNMKKGFIAIKNNLKVGDKVKLIKESGDEIVAVLEANQNGFKINSEKTEEVFVYGRQVNDFHTVDYEALSTLNISATQQLLNEIQKLKAENNSLKAEVSSLTEIKKDVEMIKSFLNTTTASSTTVIQQ